MQMPHSTGSVAEQGGALLQRLPDAPPETGRQAAEESWGDAVWSAVIGHADVILRRYYGVREFTDDTHCMLRIALGEARNAVQLADGTYIRAGETVGVLHFWNEHLPRFPPIGPDLHWAKRIEDRARRSLEILADHVAHDPEWAAIQAFRGNIALSGGRPRLRQMRRLADRYGFEVKDDPAIGAVRALGEDMVIWALTRAFNPVATRRQTFFRHRREVWISRRQLLARYGEPE
jgi:hypothetical protein